MVLDVAQEMTAVVSISSHYPRTWSLLLARKHEGPVTNTHTTERNLGICTRDSVNTKIIMNVKNVSLHKKAVSPLQSTMSNSFQRPPLSDRTTWGRRSPWWAADSDASSRYDGYDGNREHRIWSSIIYIPSLLQGCVSMPFTWRKVCAKWCVCVRVYLSRLIKMTLSESSISPFSSLALLPNSSACIE